MSEADEVPVLLAEWTITLAVPARMPEDEALDLMAQMRLALAASVAAIEAAPTELSGPISLELSD